MAMIIETTDDLIRLLRENEEFRAAARRELLTEELLELPNEFRKFKTETEKRFDAIDQRFDGIDRRLDAMDERFDGVDRRFDGIDRRLDDMRGYLLEGKMPTRLRQRIARALGLRRPKTLWMAEHYVQPPSTAEEFNDRKELALDNGDISDEEESRLEDTDMVMRARNADGQTVYIAVEASGVIGSRDIDRARDSAKILTKMYGEDSIPAVYGFAIDDNQVRQASATDELAEVHIFLESERF